MGEVEVSKNTLIGLKALSVLQVSQSEIEDMYDSRTFPVKNDVWRESFDVVLQVNKKTKFCEFWQAMDVML